MCFVNSCLPSRRRADLELEIVESIVIEVIVNDRKWAIIGTYNPPANAINLVYDDLLCKNLDRISIHYDHVMMVGDLKGT